MEKLDSILENFNADKESIIGLLQDIHKEYRYLPEDVLHEVSKRLNVPLSRLYSLVTFYSGFRLEPMGKHHVCTCVGTACHVRGAPLVVDTVERELQIKAGETTPDNNITFDTVNCVGACALGPLVTVDEDFHGKMDQKKVKKLLKELKEK